MLARAEAPLRRLIRPALWLLVVVPAIVLVAQLLLNQLGAEPIESLEHASGEWALRLLAASLAVTPLMRLTGWGWLVAQRRFLGLAAFFWAMGHLSVYIVLDQFFDWPEIVKDVLKHLYITVGMLAFVLMIPLALTSTKSSIRRLGGQRWNQLHRLVYVTAVAGCVHYLWAVKKDIAEPLLYAAVFVVLFVLRLVLRKPGPRTSRPLPPPTPVPSPGS
ncbi:sulfite oxidase heme-binding subunit YedZ [Gemmatimonas sp.]|jgi:sulfoxide reductase heme-binding subunit YedZ|uniref:sulfite oxidase heme-binding subunit YedZ n=1 Tax=Gemmatimonas sp. TaxID=1962908 RepID=UPI0037BFA41A